MAVRIFAACHFCPLTRQLSVNAQLLFQTVAHVRLGTEEHLQMASTRIDGDYNSLLAVRTKSRLGRQVKTSFIPTSP